MAELRPFDPIDYAETTFCQLDGELFFQTPFQEAMAKGTPDGKYQLAKVGILEVHRFYHPASKIGADHPMDVIISEASWAKDQIAELISDGWEDRGQISPEEALVEIEAARAHADLHNQGWADHIRNDAPVYESADPDVVTGTVLDVVDWGNGPTMLTPEGSAIFANHIVADQNRSARR